MTFTSQVLLDSQFQPDLSLTRKPSAEVTKNHFRGTGPVGAAFTNDNYSPHNAFHVSSMI